ncbi:hypothetical protein PoB_000156600 [Plakobranchus ocellatus]|uniref:Uncharacterized protein n=1 Tax=Plakobranchus ocellatus TaxID=259542 RepID=A0AAV3XW78_9GAST|nr:hypothetical protein PoB_000156600 [Plakobranchus ocellatus]
MRLIRKVHTVFVLRSDQGLGCLPVPVGFTSTIIIVISFIVGYREGLVLLFRTSPQQNDLNISSPQQARVAVARLETVTEVPVADLRAGSLSTAPPKPPYKGEKESPIVLIESSWAVYLAFVLPIPRRGYNANESQKTYNLDFWPPVHNKVISNFQPLRQVRLIMSGFEPSLEVARACLRRITRELLGDDKLVRRSSEHAIDGGLKRLYEDRCRFKVQSLNSAPPTFCIPLLVSPKPPKR